MEQIKEFRAVRAPAAAIAERLSDKLGVNYTRKDIANRIDASNKCRLLIIMTKYQKILAL